MGMSEARNLKVWAALLMAALAASVLMAMVLAGPAQAATLTVTTTADEQNADGLCSLREAIENANRNNQSGSADCPAGVGEDTISFAPSLSG
jgi:CSLREA domain-containing protein